MSKFALLLLFSIALFSSAQAEDDECDTLTTVSNMLECTNILTKFDTSDPLFMHNMCHDATNTSEQRCQTLKDVSCPKKEIEANCNKEDVQKFQKFVDEQRKMNNCDVTDQSEDIGCDSISYASYEVVCLNAVRKVDKKDPLGMHKLCRDSMKCIRKLAQCNPKIRPDMVNLESYCHFWDFATIEMKECFESFDVEHNECLNDFFEGTVAETAQEKCETLKDPKCVRQELELHCQKDDVRKFEKFVEEQRKMNGCKVTNVTLNFVKSEL